MNVYVINREFCFSCSICFILFYNLSRHKMLNDQQQEAFNLSLAGHNLFINGQAGTGKSHTIKVICNHLRMVGKTVAVTCTTGIACANFEDACTLHRWSGIHDGRYSSDEIEGIILSDEQTLKRIRNTDVLIVDEISMLSVKLFEQLLNLLWKVREGDDFLGGLQLIVSGDFLQLAPVPNKRYNDDGEYCFMSPKFKLLHKVTLTEVVRQKDPEFVNVIQTVSIGGKVNEDTVNYIKSLERPIILTGAQDSIKLFSTHDLVNCFNRAKIYQHHGQLVEYVSEDTGEKRFLDEITAPSKLWLKEQCPVVLIRNLSDKLCNGLQGHVTGFSATGPQVFFPSLKMTATIGKVDFSVFSPGENRILANRQQVPLLLAYALTIHKSQGMTLDKVEVDCQGIFKPGQLGVAMARCRTKEGLRVINFSPKVCLPQPDYIMGYLSTPMKEPANDLSCCTEVLPNPVEAVETFWFGDELESEVPVTEEDLEDDFNDVLASLNLGDGQQKELPEGFKVDNILKNCITEKPVTEIQAEVNTLIKDMLINNMRLCKTFCVTIFEEITNIMSILEALPGKEIKADKLTSVYAEIHKYQLSDSYRVSCLLMFEKYPNFGGSHSFLCTKLTDAVRKFVIQETIKLYDTKTHDVHQRRVSDSSKARIRYVAGYCVSTLRKTYTTTYRSNMFSSSAGGQHNYFDSKQKLSVVNAMIEQEQYLKMFSSDKVSLEDVDRRQYMSRGLLNISDVMFEFSMKLCCKCLNLLVDKNLNVHSQSLFQYCLDNLLNSEELLHDFVNVVSKNLSTTDLLTVLGSSDEVTVREVLSSTVNKVHYINSVFSDIVGKFLMVMFSQFRTDLLHSFSVAKTTAHRTQILIRQKKQKVNTEKSLTFHTILNDASEKKEQSHSLLRGLLISNVNILQPMKKAEIEKIGKAYGVSGKQNTKKDVLIEIVKKVIIASSEMPKYNVFEEGPSTSRTTSSTLQPEPPTSSSEEPQPSTSWAEQTTDKVVEEDIVQPIEIEQEDEEACGKCGKVGKEGIKWIRCNACLMWYHRNCAGLRLKKEWDKYQDESVHFLCKQCK